MFVWVFLSVFNICQLIFLFAFFFLILGDGLRFFIANSETELAFASPSFK